MTTQGVLTVVTQILPGQVAPLRKQLKQTAANGLTSRDSGDAASGAGGLRTAHFARFVIIPGLPDEETEPEGRYELVFSTAYDGARRHHLAELAMRASRSLCDVFAHCRGFPESARTAPATLIAFLEEHALSYGAMHVGYVGRTVSDITAEENLRQFLQSRLDGERATGSFESMTSRAIRDRVISWVAESEYRWALAPREAPIAPWVVEEFWPDMARAGAVLVPLLGIFPASAAVTFGLPGFLAYWAGVGVVALAGYSYLRHLEESEPAKVDTDVSRQGLLHAEDEDTLFRNQLSHLVDVKPGLFRHVLLRGVLFAIEVLARVKYYQGDLGGIQTIHCAHWVYLKGPKPRLLFFSNYDGSWERYLGDFIEEASPGMTSVWSNTSGFPKTERLVRAGVKDERVFKAWTRDHQIKTQVWFAADPDISIRNIKDNSALRDGLRGFMNEEQAAAWLGLL